MARYDSGSGSAASSSPEASPRIASRIGCIRRDYRPVALRPEMAQVHCESFTSRPSQSRRSVQWPDQYIVAGARTPIGKLSGALASFSAAQLGGLAIKAALERAGVSPDEVDYVFMGQVLGAGQGQITARQAAVNAGIPMTVAATTVNKVCLSGLNTIYLADLMIQAGEADIVIAGGMESMTNAPYLLPGARGGFRYGDTDLQSTRSSATASGARSTRASWERAPRSTPRRADLPRAARRPRGEEPRACRRRHQGRSLQRRDRHRRRSRSARVIPCSSTPTKGCVPAPRSSRSAR